METFKQWIKHNTYASYLLVIIMTGVYWIVDHLYFKKKKQVIFTSFSGKQYSDSPKVIYEAMKQSCDFNDYEFKWGLIRPEHYDMIPEEEKININSFRYIIELMTSSVWVTNASIERLIPYKPKHVLYINTWHGVPLKYIGADDHHVNWLTKHWYLRMKADLITACSEYDKIIFRHVFPCCHTIQEVGLPRNEVLIPKENDNVSNKTIVLYAPTFRDDISSTMFDEPTFFEQFDDVIFLMRHHYFSDNHYEQMIDVSDKDLNELLQVADVLITDYSSMMFDYALLEKPLVLYPYDLSDYMASRGLYIDYDKLNITKIYNQDDLRQYINQLPQNKAKEIKKVQQLKATYQSQEQSSTQYILDYIRRDR